MTSLWYTGSKFTLLNSLFDAVTLTKNANPDKYPYSWYGIIRFDVRWAFSMSDGSVFGENVMILGLDSSSDTLYGTTLTAEAKYYISYSEQQKKFA